MRKGNRLGLAKMRIAGQDRFDVVFRNNNQLTLQCFNRIDDSINFLP